MKVVVQSMVEEKKRKNFRLTALQNDLTVSQILEMFIDKFIANPKKVLEMLK